MSRVKNIKVWCPDDEEEPAQPNYTCSLYDVAAELYAQDRYDQSDMTADHYHVNVRDKEGVLHRYQVDVEYEPSFVATDLDDVDKISEG